MTNEELNNLQAEAYEHLWNGRHRLALSAAEKIYEYRPHDSETAICLAWAHLENGNPSKAMDYANLAVELKGESSKTRFFRAYLLSRMSIFEGAIADIDKTLEKEKSLLSWTYLTKARSYAGLKKFDEAKESIELGYLLDAGKNQRWNEIRKWYDIAPTVFSESYLLKPEKVHALLKDAHEAIKAKEYWFALLSAQKILNDDKIRKERDEAELLEIEAMYYLFQYRPALKKSESIKNKFKNNNKFNVIYSTLQKFVITEEEELEKDRKPLKKTKNDLPYEHLDLSKTPDQSIEFKSSAVYYPNEYSQVVSIKIFDAIQDAKYHKRNFFKHISKNIPAVGAEVIFNYPFYGKEDRSYSCHIVWYLNDIEVGRNNFRLNIPKEWDSVVFTQTMGSEHSGFWKFGQAKVELYINNFKVGEKLFGVSNTNIPEEEIFEPPQSKQTKETPAPQQQRQIPTKSLEELLSELDSYIGLNNVKQSVRDFISYLKFIKERKRHGLKTDEKISINAIFLGNPGSGKTTIARLLGNIFQAIGILPSSHVVEVDRAGLVGQYIGETAQKTEKIINDAIGGILFIDEAYTLIKKGGSGQDFGQEAIDILLKRMEDKKGEFVVIAAGYTGEMNGFLNSNPGLKSRFTHTFTFEDYTPDELMQILQLYLKKEEYQIATDAETILLKEFVNLYRKRDQSFGNARLVRKIFEDAKINLSKRVLNISEGTRTKDLLNTITAEDINLLLKKSTGKQFTLPINEEILKEALCELNNLVGLESLKKEINDLVKLARFFAEQGEDLREKFGNHYLFLGNPGTGKTTVARIFSKIFSALGILSKGHLVETDRQGLVAGYVGQTAEKTTAMIDKSFGGTLFIDEAYALVKTDGSGSDFGKEAIDILLKRMEDERGKFIVIVAGYTDEMKRFIASNPGMESRFGKSLLFEDYSPSELMEIVHRTLIKEKKKLTKESEEALFKYLNELHSKRDKKFGNARIVRNILESVKQKLLLRVAGIPQDERTDELVNTITSDDIKETILSSNQANDYQVKGDPLKLQEFIDELNSLTGLEKVKEGVFKLISDSKIAQLKKERGLQILERNYNTIFMGNDGTGKTTVARLLSKILKELGILNKGHLVKVDRSDLIGGYQGQTAHKTEEVIKEAIGGTLYLEDAHTLARDNNDFGLEAIDTMIKKMNDYKNKMVIIIAGPTDKMRSFVDSYPELKTNFKNIIEFDDYKPRQLLAITYEIADKHGYSLDEGALQTFLEIFTELYENRDNTFSNALAAKNILYAAISNQEQRIAGLLNPSDDDLKNIILEDVQAVKI